MARRLLGAAARIFDRASTLLLKRWHGSLSWQIFKVLQGIEGELSERATYIAVGMGRCICCGGDMLLHGHVRNGMPYVYLACGKCKGTLKCALYDKAKKTCGVESSCRAFQDDGTIKRRVAILFNLVIMILHFFNSRGKCLVDDTRDTRDAVSILRATRGIEAARYLTYYVFYKDKIPVDEKDTTIISVSDVDAAIKAMTGSEQIAAIVDKMKR